MMHPGRRAAAYRASSILGLLLVTIGGCVGPERGAESAILGIFTVLIGIVLAVAMIYAIGTY